MRRSKPPRARVSQSGAAIGRAAQRDRGDRAEQARRERCGDPREVLLAVGASFGGIAAGPVAAWLTPIYGWQVMFWIGGLVPLAFAVLAYFALPESLKFLALHPERKDQVVTLVRALAPNKPVPANATFVIRGEPKAIVAL